MQILWKGTGFPGKFCRKFEFPQNLLTRKLVEITVFYAVDSLKNVVIRILEKSLKKFFLMFSIKEAAVCFQQPHKTILSEQLLLREMSNYSCLKDNHLAYIGA